MTGQVAVPRISVALCTRNGAQFIEEQIASIASQTVPVSEIVVSDDASTDATIDIVRRAVPSTSNIEVKVLANESPLGVTANFEQAIRACGHSYIALSDQDDRWRPDRVERALQAFAKHPRALLIASDAVLIDAQGDRTRPSLLSTLGVTGSARRALSTPDAFATLLRRNMVTGATFMVRRELMESSPAFPSSWVHDEWLAILAALRDGLVLVDEPLIEYRQHAANVIGATALSRAKVETKLRESRSARNARLLARAIALEDHLAAGGYPADRAAMVTAKVAHERARSALPDVRLARVCPVAKEWGGGGYRAYGYGIGDVLRDLVQPL